MLTIEKTVLPSPEQWEIIIEGMRNPKNSWDRMDSKECDCSGYNCMVCPGSDNGGLCKKLCTEKDFFLIGPNDHTLMTQLAEGGPVHAKYRRMIPVYVTINAPLYWWKEFDTYKIGTVCNSCSTMHKIHAKEFVIDDFSYEHLIDDIEDCWYEDLMAGPECRSTPEDILSDTIYALNIYRNKFLEAKTKPMKEESKRDGLVKRYWWQMIQLLPASYNQKRTIMLNYEVLVGIYKWRKNHKLDEWHTFCDWIEKLPYSELITGKVIGSE